MATETLRIANKVAKETLFEYETRSSVCSSVTASNGVQIEPDVLDWKNANDIHMIVICAGYNPEKYINAGFRAFLSRTAKNLSVVGGFDTGSIILAKLGYLAGYKAILHYEAMSGFREDWPDIDISDQIYCLDRGRLTAAGGTAAGDALLAWIESNVSTDLALATAQAMSHGCIRKQNEKQHINISADPILINMRNLMLDNLNETLPISEIADHLKVTQRHLLNRCKRTYGYSVSSYYQNLRLERAQELLISTQLSITEISTMVGYGSLAGFSNAFSSFFKKSPLEMRAQS